MIIQQQNSFYILVQQNTEYIDKMFKDKFIIVNGSTIIQITGIYFILSYLAILIILERFINRYTINNVIINQ